MASTDIAHAAGSVTNCCFSNKICKKGTTNVNENKVNTTDSMLKIKFKTAYFLWLNA